MQGWQECVDDVITTKLKSQSVNDCGLKVSEIKVETPERVIRRLASTTETAACNPWWYGWEEHTKLCASAYGRPSRDRT